MPKYNIAGIIVEMNPKYDRTAKQAKPYLIDTTIEPAFKLDLSIDRINELKKIYDYLTLDDIEYIFLGQLFYRYILQHNGDNLASFDVFF